MIILSLSIIKILYYNQQQCYIAILNKYAAANKIWNDIHQLKSNIIIDKIKNPCYKTSKYYTKPECLICIIHINKSIKPYSVSATIKNNISLTTIRHHHHCQTGK